jgi:virginiamycin B lyase
MTALSRTAAVTLFALLAAGCGGGSSSSLIPSPITAQSAATKSITVSPAQLAFTATGTAQSFTATQSGGGPMSAASDNAQVASVSGSANKSGTFTVTAIGAGNCVITVSDKKGTTATVAVSVTLPTPPPAAAPTILHQYAIPASNQSFGMSNAADGSVWYTQWYNGGVGDINPSGSTSTYPLAASKPYGIAPGSDGNFWIPDNANDQIDVVTPSGALIASYPLAYAPMEIAKGSDGNLWFTAEDSSLTTGFSEIVQITSSGAMTAYPTSTSAQTAKRYAHAITAGPDGRLWFTEGNYIGAIATSGAMTEYPIPSGRSSDFITSGPDGNLWFTEAYGNEVGRITPSGSVTEYAVPTLFASPWMIAAGKDGALWFTEEGGTGQIGRVTTTGSVTEYPITNLSGEPAILAGADGNLWIPSANGVMYVLSY